MTKRRTFLKNTVLTGISSTLLPVALHAADQGANKKKLPKHWVWINPRENDKEEDLNVLYSKYAKAGIKGIFFEADSERHYRIARKHGIQSHRWMWIMNRGERSLLTSHPEWYAVSRNGNSCSDKPPYVGYYRWLCPSREEVIQYLESQVRETLEKDYVDGIHLDYIRFCDVKLPVNLWDNYRIEQTRELPEYDFCYCEVCREKFKASKQKDPLDIQYPDESLSWRLFRYNAITNVVRRMADVAKSFQKPVTAAVFPTPEVARRNVRQDWVNWPLTGIFPMIYHGFYKEDVSWIGDAVEEGVKALNKKFPLYAGLYLPDFKNNEEIKAGVQTAMAHGAAGISFFGKLTDEVLGILADEDKRSK